MTGQELLDEQMIKLPLNIATSGQKSWKNVLTQARDKRLALERKAHEYFAQAGEGRLIRPDRAGSGRAHGQGPAGGKGSSTPRTCRSS